MQNTKRDIHHDLLPSTTLQLDQKWQLRVPYLCVSHIYTTGPVFVGVRQASWNPSHHICQTDSATNYPQADNSVVPRQINQVLIEVRLLLNSPMLVIYRGFAVGSRAAAAARVQSGLLHLL